MKLLEMKYIVRWNEINVEFKLHLLYLKKIDFQRNLNIFSPIINMHGSSEVLVYATIEIKLKEYYLQ